MIEKNPGRTKFITMTAVTIGIVLLLVVPLMGILIMNGSEHSGEVEYADQTGAPTGDASMDASSRDSWENFLKTAPTVEVTPDIPNTTVGDGEYDIIDSLPGGIEERGNYDNATLEGSGDQAGGAPAKADSNDDSAKGESTARREVEEADIVKAVGNRLYLLNSYMGFLSVNMEDPSSPYIEGRTMVLGNPVSMYIVDFLGFVIVSNAPALRGSGDPSSGRLYILDLTDRTAPRVVGTVDLDGYPVDSRRVGEVIYIISTKYAVYSPLEGGIGIRDTAVDSAEGDEVSYSGESGTATSPGDQGPSTTIVSVGFFDPRNLGEIDRKTINGDSGKIHASQFAIFIPRSTGDWDHPETTFTYIDISDPRGEIRVRGSITIKGYLRDRYQMDHYRGMFRVVTQEQPERLDREDRFPSSTLYVVDTRDPDRLKVASHLLIDDEGNLMATRFAGDRAYTIHLPESLDPLDVIDLARPDDPKLTDVLDIPGWVEHIEVVGYNLIALGVDNDKERKVALYLFDVSNPEDALLLDREVIGEGYTYSEASWDPKALTLLKEEGLVVIPYSSYGQDPYYNSEFGVQLVSFDLDKGKLDVRGKVTCTSPVTRSRLVNGNLVTTSDMVLQSVDIENPDSPVLEVVLNLSTNIRDVVVEEGRIVSLVQPRYGSSGSLIRVSGMDDPYNTILEVGVAGLRLQEARRNGDLVYIKGIREGGGTNSTPFWELHPFDMSDPMHPLELETARIRIPDDYLSSRNPYYLDDTPKDTDVATTDETVAGPVMSYDPFGWTLLSDGTVAVTRSSAWSYNYRYGDEAPRDDSVERITLFHWSGNGSVQVRSVYLPSTIGITNLVGSWNGLCFQNYDRYPGSELYRVTFYRGAQIVTGNMTIMGRLIGTSDDMDLVYTSLDYWLNDATNSTLNIYNISTGRAEYMTGLDLGETLDQVKFDGDRIVAVSHNQDYPFYYGGYPEIGYDEVMVSGEKGSSGGGSTSAENEREEGPRERPTYNTTIHVIQMDRGLFGAHSAYSVEGLYYNEIILDNTVILQREHSVIGISLDGSALGAWIVNGYLQGGDVSGNVIALAMGFCGIEVFTL